MQSSLDEGAEDLRLNMGRYAQRTELFPQELRKNGYDALLGSSVARFDDGEATLLRRQGIVVTHFAGYEDVDPGRHPADFSAAIAAQHGHRLDTFPGVSNASNGGHIECRADVFAKGPQSQRPLQLAANAEPDTGVFVFELD